MEPGWEDKPLWLGSVEATYARLRAAQVKAGNPLHVGELES